MNIFIATDSRGSHDPQKKSEGWTTQLQKRNPSHHYVHCRSGVEKPMVTMFQIESVLSEYKDGFFDLAFFQIGYHEGVEFYSKEVFETFFGQRFNPHALIIDEHNRFYRYWDKAAFENFFAIAKRKSKRAIFIGFPSLEKFRGPCKETASFINEQVAPMATDYIALPQETDWASMVTHDNIHYNEKGREYIIDKTEEFLNTFTSLFLERASQKSSKNHQLYLDSLEMGKAIAEKTKPREVILLAKKSGNELYAAFIGAILVGRTPLIIQRPSPKVHQSFFEKRMSDLQDQVKATLCFCETQDNEKFSQFFTCINSLTSQSEGDCPIYVPSPSDLAFVQMSSGTTGVSKICEITHNQIVKHCREYGKVVGMGSAKSVVSWLPLYHDMGLVAAFLLPIIHEAEFHIIDPFDWLMNPKSLLELASQHKGTHCWMPSFAFNYLANKVSLESIPNVRLDSLEKVISCSEPTFCDDLMKFGEKFKAIGLSLSSIHVCYALAENVFAVSQTDSLEEYDWKGVKYASCGSILKDVKVKIIREGNDVTNKDDGEVWITSPFMPRTNKCVDGWYNTGDIGFLVGEHLFIIGRAKDMFVSYGVNVYPEMIEHLIANTEGVVPGRVVCFGVFSKEQGTNKVVVCAETEDVTNNKLRTELSSIIREEFGLTAIVILVAAGSLIKTSSGKFCRIKNKETYGKINA